MAQTVAWRPPQRASSKAAAYKSACGFFYFRSMVKESALNKIAKVSGNVAKSFFGFDVPYGAMSTEVLNPISYRSSGSIFGNEGWNFGAANGYDVYFSYSGLDAVVKAYERCAPVFSIINKQAYAYVNGKNKFRDDNDKDVSNTHQKQVAALLNNPNPFQNGKQFKAQAKVYCRLFGYCVILPDVPSGFPIEDAKRLWIIPPYMCEIVYRNQSVYTTVGGQVPNFIEKIIVTYGNEKTTLLPEQVFILKEITPGFSGNPFIPSSPIKSVQQNISNVIGIYDSKGMLINYRGALGILSPEKDPAGNIPIEEPEKKDIQDGLMRYGLRNGQWKFIVANSSMKWQQIGISYKDLMLSEWAEDDTMVIADSLNYPPKLLMNSQRSSLAGTEVDAFKKQLYQDHVIPYAEMIDEQLSQMFETQKYGYSIKSDYSHVAVLQEDKINAGRSRYYLNQGCLLEWQNNLLTANEWRALNAMEPLADGDKYYTDWVNAGKIFGAGKTTASNADTVAQAVNDNPNN